MGWSSGHTEAHPGVLQCSPGAIVQSTGEELVKAANLVDFFESIPLLPAVKQSLDKVALVIFFAVVYSRLQACSGGTCGLS